MLGNERIKPAASTLTTLFTATAETVVSSIVVCNLTASATVFSVAVRPLGAAINDAHYIYFNLPISACDTFVLTAGIALQNTDVISVYSTSADLSFNIFYST